jgi:DNA repair protein RadD
MVGRGFRLCDGKENCLVLDFGGNVLRHGPVDAIRIHTPRRNGNGDAPAKQCPVCQSIVATGYALCPDCGYAFPPPERQPHEATASTAGILSGEITTTTYPVDAVHYSVHRKRGAGEDAPRTLRVDYRIGFHTFQSEWVSIEHAGWARAKAASWWYRRSNAPVPATAAEAAELAEAGALCETLSITVRSVVGEKYSRIIDYEMGSRPRWLIPGEQEVDGQTAPVTNGIFEIPDDDIPF